MATMEILLSKPVVGLGEEGDQVRVRAGYARNYLLPRGLAMCSSQGNKRLVAHLVSMRQERERQELAEAKVLEKKMSQANVVIKAKTAVGGTKLFGAVTANDLFEQLAAAGIHLDSKRRIQLKAGSIKELGTYRAQIRLHSEVICELSFDVVAATEV